MSRTHERTIGLEQGSGSFAVVPGLSENDSIDPLIPELEGYPKSPTSTCWKGAENNPFAEISAAGNGSGYEVAKGAQRQIDLFVDRLHYRQAFRSAAST